LSRLSVAVVAIAVLLGALSVPAFAAPPKVSQAEAIAAADRDPNVIEEGQKNGTLSSSASVNDDGIWEVAYFADDHEVALVLVDPETAAVKESWTGDQVAWKMARGYSGQFGHKLNAPYVFLPLCAIFLLGLVDWKRWRRVANLDLLVLLGFGVSHFFFNQGEIGVSAPLQYLPLLYLLGRALWLGFRGTGEGLRPVWPVAWLMIAALFLMGFRVGLNVADSGSVDVGYASIVGADRIAHGEPIYGNFPDDVSQGDTYGPVNYFAYVPFERIWPWSGSWDDVPGAHAAAVSFDIITFALLILLAIRIRPGPAGRRLAAILAFGWAAYPYTAFPLESNSNDTLVAMLLVGTLVLLARPLARGATLALATFAKFVPAVLAPMLLTYEDRRRSMLLFAVGFGLAAAAAMLWPALDPGLRTVYDRTVGFQASRDSPFSIWGQVAGIEWLRTLLLVAIGALSILLALRPRRKSLIQVAAFGAALIIAVQITLHHWFYLYIIWFYPLLLVAIAAVETRTEGPEPEPSPERSSRPAPVG
jgi:Glycosyltransferase family 87